MSTGKLSPLQEQVLTLLAAVPGWVLSGGGSLVGFHLAHRTTRDLDLFVRGSRSLDPLTLRAVEDHLVAAGLTLTRQTTSAHFVRWLVTGDETTVLDLIADPVPAIEPSLARTIGGVVIQVDSAPEILANKLCALLSRTELRDLVDVRGLLATGLPLEAGLAGAAQKDAGFSPLVLANLLGSIDFVSANRRGGLSEPELRALIRFTSDLADACVRTAWPARSDEF